MPLHLFEDHNFNFTIIAGLIIGVSRFGALAICPPTFRWSPAQGQPKPASW
ncbi:hypothetical protein AB0362_03975 [Rhodococcus sp. NPDC079359]|uniref:hypothetical protein n=1 Tax=Rhodococcus sp. NPDC079359 TaxID=3154961 RepID=UPI0034501544